MFSFHTCTCTCTDRRRSLLDLRAWRVRGEHITTQKKSGHHQLFFRKQFLPSEYQQQALREYISYFGREKQSKFSTATMRQFSNMQLLFVFLAILQFTAAFTAIAPTRALHSSRFAIRATVESAQEKTSSKRKEENPHEFKSTQPIRRYRTAKKEPLIAIIGRPNVGKSALVNRISGTQSGGAIVADESGITRDRTYREANFLGENFQLVDTGGLVFDDDEGTLFAKEIRQQANVAIDESAGVILVVDGKVGLTSMDLAIADFLRREVLHRMPVVVAVNKCESEVVGALNSAEFWNLGLGEPVPVSALHGVGTAELLEGLFAKIVKAETAGVAEFGTKVLRLQEAKQRKNNKGQMAGEDDTEYKMRKYGIGDVAKQAEQEYEDALKAFDSEERPEEINIAIVGRPNVGKSSLLNNLFGDSRAIVSEMAGTTRDSIDAAMERPAEKEGDLPRIYRFVDTAGIRRKGKIQFGPEFFMVNRALRAIRRADVGKNLCCL
jgi:ribosome-associated GTPase EngA